MTFKSRIANKERLIGTILSLPSPELAEIASRAGLDWVWIDLEHSPTGLLDVQRMIQATGGRVATLVRVPWNDPVWIKRVLDLGCDGVIVPQIRSAAEALAAVSACLYPPAGERSIGIARAQQFGMEFQQYIETANNHVCVILQIEHREGVDRIDEILSVPGFDAVLVGPYDLSGSYGVLGQVGHPKVVESMARTRASAKTHNRAVGIFAADVQTVQIYLSNGYTLIAMSTDAMIYGNAIRRAANEMRAVVSPSPDKM